MTVHPGSTTYRLAHTNEEVSLFWQVEGDSVIVSSVQLQAEEWEAMGRPSAVTITVEAAHA